MTNNIPKTQSLPDVPLPPFSVDGNIFNADLNPHAYLKKHHGKKLKLGIACGIFLEIIILYFIFLDYQNGGLKNNRVLYLLFAPAVGYVVILAYFQRKLRREFYRQFARINGYTYQKSGWLTNHTGALFKIGRSKKMEDIIQGQIANLPFYLFNYHYTVQYGKQSHTFRRTVWEIDFQMPVPPMLLLVDWHEFGDDISDNNLKYVSKIVLDEALEKHFSLFAEKKFETETLQIFTPEFLNLLFEKYKQFSLNFSGSSLLVYAHGIITSKDELMNMKKCVNEIAGRLAEKLPAMQGAISALHEALSKIPPPSALARFSGQVSRVMDNPTYRQPIILAITIIILIFSAVALINLFLN